MSSKRYNDLRSAFAIKGLIASSGAKGTLSGLPAAKTRSPRSLRSLVLRFVITLATLWVILGKLKQAMLGLSTVLATAGTILRMLNR